MENYKDNQLLMPILFNFYLKHKKCCVFVRNSILVILLYHLILISLSNLYVKHSNDPSDHDITLIIFSVPIS